MNRLSLTRRILLVIIVVQAVLFAALAVASIESIRRDIAAESRLATATARALVLATVGTMQGSVPQDRLMAQLPDRLVPPRHVRITVMDANGGVLRQPRTPQELAPTAPAWFAAWVAPRPQEIRMPVVLEGRPRGVVTITGDPLVEIGTAWRDLRQLLLLMALAAVVQAALIVLATRHTLRPVTTIARSLGSLRRGELDSRIGPLPQPDLAPLASGVDALASALQQADIDRATLQRRVVTRGDDERKAVARDLHDEMGPCLFGLRVETEALQDAAPTPAIAAHARAIATIADEISRVNRALLNDLRPMAIGQLPLAVVLADYVDDLNRRFPDLTVLLEVAPGLQEPDEATALTLFRIIQEGATNALRHSDAGQVTIRLWTDPAHWRMILSDDGKGLSPDAREGTGLTGMRERITLLGGKMALTSTAGAGTRIQTTLPLTQAE